MNSSRFTQGRRLLLLCLVAAVAVHAQSSQADNRSSDVQKQVQSVLAGSYVGRSLSELQAQRVTASVADIQENTRQILLGSHRSNTDSRFSGLEFSTASN